MAMGSNVTGFSSLAEVLSERGLDGLGSAMEIVLHEAMRIELDKHLNATAYERTELRSGYAAVNVFVILQEAHAFQLNFGYR